MRLWTKSVYRNNRSLPRPDTGLTLEPMSVDNPVRGSTALPKGRQAVTQQSLTGYVEDLEQGGRVLTREELELLIRKAGGQP